MLKYEPGSHKIKNSAEGRIAACTKKSPMAEESFGFGFLSEEQISK